MNKILCLIFFIFILTISCKKKTTQQEPEKPEVQKIDTLKPSSYLPVFPGSYWKYINPKGDTIIYTTSAKYEKDTYTDVNGALTTTVSAYVPKYNGVFIWQGYCHTGPIYNYGMKVTNSLIPIVPEAFDIEEWTIYQVGHDRHFCRTLKIDTTIEISGKSYFPTVVIGTYGSYSNGGDVLYIKEYYTKDIGLIKHEDLIDPNSEFHLINYHINK